MPRPRVTPEAKALANQLLATMEELRRLDPKTADVLERRIRNRYATLRKQHARRQPPSR
jgi:hypothetical protein